MEGDFITNPEAFSEANHRSWLRHLRSLTLESAAEELEQILNLGPELERSSEEMGAPPPLVNPLPGPSLAILLAGSPSDDDERPETERP